MNTIKKPPLLRMMAFWQGYGRKLGLFCNILIEHNYTYILLETFQEEPMFGKKTQVVVEPKDGGFVAYVPGKMQMADVKASEHEALGALLAYHSDLLGIDLEFRTEEGVALERVNAL